MKYFKATGLSLPIEVIIKIDNERGDIPRSKYILRILERMYLNTNTQGHAIKEKDPLDGGFESHTSSGPRSP